MTAARWTWDLCKTLRDVTAAASRNYFAAEGRISARVDLMVLEVLCWSIIPKIKGDIDRGADGRRRLHSCAELLHSRRDGKATECAHGKFQGDKVVRGL